MKTGYNALVIRQGPGKEDADGNCNLVAGFAWFHSVRERRDSVS
jgi:hypothetical protein